MIISTIDVATDVAFWMQDVLRKLSLFTFTGESVSVGYIDTSAGLWGGGADELGHMVAH